MKTIITDKYNLVPNLFSWFGLRSLWLGYAEWQQGATFIACVDASFGVFWLAFAIQRVLERRLARQEGRDQSILRVEGS